MPAANQKIRSRLNDELTLYGPGYLQEKLKAADTSYFSEVDINNPQRMIRALEVFENTGEKFSSFRKAVKVARPFEIITFGLTMERGKLYERINNRVELMISNGLVEEVRSLIPYRSLNALNTVGYSELFDYFDGKSDLNTAITAVKQNTRRYAKRQLTWFRKENKIIWIDASDPSFIKNITEQAVTSFNRLCGIQ